MPEQTDARRNSKSEGLLLQVMRSSHVSFYDPRKTKEIQQLLFRKLKMPTAAEVVLMISGLGAFGVLLAHYFWKIEWLWPGVSTAAYFLAMTVWSLRTTEENEIPKYRSALCTTLKLVGVLTVGFLFPWLVLWQIFSQKPSAFLGSNWRIHRFNELEQETLLLPTNAWPIIRQLRETDAQILFEVRSIKNHHLLCALRYDGTDDDTAACFLSWRTNQDCGIIKTSWD